MKRYKKFIILAFVGTCFIVLPSGAWAQFAQTDLAGTWYESTLFSGAIGTWERSVINIDEAGNFTSTITEENGDEEIVTGALTISEEGIINTAAEGPSTFQGVMNAAKNIITFTDTYEDEVYALSVLVKSGSELVQDDFTGNWYQHTLYNNSVAYWDRGTFIIDEMGDVTAEVSFPDGEQIPAELPGFLNMINLADDGLITSDLDIQGAMSPDKNMFVFTASYEDGTSGLSIFLKNDAEYAQSDLAGIWYMQSLYAGEAQFWTKTIMQFDEEGIYAGKGIDASGSEIAGTGAVTVSEDGIIVFPEAPSYQGTLSNDKNMIVLTGSDENETFFTLAVLTRLSEEEGPVNGGETSVKEMCDSKWAECLFNCGSVVNCQYDCHFMNQYCYEQGEWPDRPLPNPAEDSEDYCNRCNEDRAKCEMCKAENGDDPFMCNEVCGSADANCQFCINHGGGIR